MRIMGLALLLSLTTVTLAEQITVSHAIALRGEPKYSADFQHWDYVNPDAPRGGYVTYGQRGNFDNFNRYAQRGVSAPMATSAFDSLMVENDDEDSVLYGLIAEKIEYPDDYSWVIFHIDPRAKHQDGKPITAEDVEFSFTKFMTQGVPFFAQTYEGVTPEIVSPQKIKFKMPGNDKSLLIQLATLTIFPKHIWQDIDLAEPVIKPVVGSGAYEVQDYSMGQYVVWNRKKDYWALNHPVNKGMHNFDTTRIDMYKDDTVLLEAFKKGELDFRSENVSKLWATAYVGDNFDKGYIVKEEIASTEPQAMQAFIFNTTRPQLSDPKVREALGYMFDFEWTNKNLFYGAYSRSVSYFQNTDYMARGLPEGEELELLNRYKDQLPKEVFTKEYNPPKTDGTGNIRPQSREALKLLREAGWNLKEGKLLNKDGEQLKFELMLWSPNFERVVIPFQENLKRIGVDMSVRLVDLAQATNRLRDRDYDMLIHSLGGGVHPSTSLRLEFHSKYIDSTYNNSGFTSKATDEIIEQIIDNQENLDKLLPLGKALDRILLWQHLVIPQWYSGSYRVAYWNKFSRPATKPKYGLGQGTWWYDARKAKTLPDDRNAPN